MVIGVRSSGIHSNGLTLARNAFFERHRYAVDHKFAELSATIGEELLRPTDIYVREAMEIIAGCAGSRRSSTSPATACSTSPAWPRPVGYEIDRLIEPHPLFPLIQRHAGVDDGEMFEVFNMGIGFCYVVDPADAELTLSILKNHGRVAQRIGTAVADPQKIVHIPQRNLAGQHKRFWRDDHAARRAG